MTPQIRPIPAAGTSVSAVLASAPEATQSLPPPGELLRDQAARPNKCASWGAREMLEKRSMVPRPGAQHQVAVEEPA